LSRNDRLLVLVGLLVLVLLAVLYFFLILSPLRAEYAAAVAEREQLQARRAELERQVAELENIRRDSPTIQRQILEYSRRIPDEDEIDTLVVQIEEIGENSGVTWTSITPESPTAPPGGGDFSVVPITMSFEGGYDELQDFLTRLKNLSRLVTVNEITYEEAEPVEGGGTNGGGTDGTEGETADDQGAETDLLTVEIVAETYVQPVGAPADVTAPPETPSTQPGGSTTGGGSTSPGGTTGGS
jgi:type IV pilus assembly protein PilO